MIETIVAQWLDNTQNARIILITALSQLTVRTIKMQIINHKTGSIFTAYTVQDRAGFASCITIRQANREVLIGREVYPTRSRAYKSAVKFCKARAAREGVTA